MELKSFRVRNFRSINDSGEIDVSRITAMLGRNESGKSNILRALHSLNPADGFKKLKPIKDFPRHRKLSECNDHTPVVDSTWLLNEYEQGRLAEIWPSAQGVTEVGVSRRYGDKRYVGISVPEAAFDLAAIKADARKIDAAVKAGAAKLTDDSKTTLERASDAFVSAIGVGTTAIRKRWKDRELKVRFNLDAHHFDTLISDPNSIYDVEVNLDERSRGFQWFFAFYVVFAADTEDGDADGAILLLDEPGLYLHARSQGDLLRHLEDDFSNQIIYTTHSPFMVPTHQLDWVRTVNIAEDVGTTVSNDPTGDARTLFPLQAALGYDLAQSLFVGPNNLVVEGVTDFWILSAVSAYLNEQGKAGLDARLTVTPAGGAQKVHYMVALLTSEQLKVLVLFDDEKDAKATRDDLVKGKLIRSDNVVFVSEAFATAPAEADIEDILDPKVYESLVREAYAKELKGKKLELNNHVPRIARRFEAAFDALSIGFQKTRPARLFLQKIASDPSSVLPAESEAQFERLCKAINTALEKHVAR